MKINKQIIYSNIMNSILSKKYTGANFKLFNDENEEGQYNRFII